MLPDSLPPPEKGLYSPSLDSEQSTLEDFIQESVVDSIHYRDNLKELMVSMIDQTWADMNEVLV